MQRNQREISSPMKVMGEREAVIACIDKSIKIGATMWDLKTEEKLFHIPTCLSPPFDFLCLRNRFLVGFQSNKPRLLSWSHCSLVFQQGNIFLTPETSYPIITTSILFIF